METVLFVSEDLDEEFVYNLSKTLWEDIDSLAGISENRKDMLTIESAIDSIGSDHLHSGATKYLTEKGIIEQLIKRLSGNR